MELAKFFKFLRLTPNTVSTFSLVFFILGGCCFFIGTYQFNVLGGISFLIGILMDCTDGKLARMTNNTSNLGIWLDYNYDYLKPLCIYMPISMSLFRDTGSSTYFLLALIIITATSLQAIITLRWNQFPFSAEEKQKFTKKSKFHKIGKQFYFFEGIEPLLLIIFAALSMLGYFIILWSAIVSLMYLITTFTLGRIIRKKDIIAKR